MKWFPSDYFRSNVAMRNDTLLGVCEALGQDLGFHPNFLRVPLAAGIVIAPFWMVGIYMALGVLVFLSRASFPDRTQAAAPPAAESLPLRAENEEMELPRAA